MRNAYREAADRLEELPVAIRVARRMRGLDYRDAAEAAGVSTSAFYNLETGKRSVSMKSAIKLLRWLDEGAQGE